MKVFLLVSVVLSVSACSSTAPAPQATPPAASGSAMITATTKSPEALARFRAGETLFFNVRSAEAAEEFTRALQLDPGFVLAHAYHAQAVLGAEGGKEIDEAASASSSLPESERLLIQGIAAGFKGENKQAETLLQKLVEVAPADWRSHYALGVQLLGAQKYREAVGPLRKATEMNADAAIAHNMLGYASLRQGDTAGAIAAFEQYARALPQEPNTQDSLGEALMAAGRFADAEAAFNKALSLSPQFWVAHQGIAYTKFYAGDWTGGRKALDEAKAAAQRSTDKVSVDGDIAAAAAAQGRTADALQALDAAARTAGADPGIIAFIPVRRGEVLIRAGRARDAITAAATALKAADDTATPVAIAVPLRTQALRVRVTAESQLRDSQAAAMTAAQLESAAMSRPDDPAAQTAMHYANGMLALAKGDTAAARTHFTQCSAEDDVCQWQNVVAIERSGDKAAATAARDQWLRLFKRDPVHLMVRSQLTTKPRNAG